MYLLRLLTPIQTRLQNMVNKVPTAQEDIDVAVSLVDEWGRGFVAELDYSEEARNAERFTAEVDGTELGESVFAPRVVGALSSRRILTTEWVEGERLDACRAPADVPRLCSVAMIAYLQMMLDSGTLHCDPHPGNLLRTPDGRLCVLDWGLVTSIESDLQLTLIEHLSLIHISEPTRPY